MVPGLLIAVVACGSVDDGGASSADGSPLTGRITVFAAASLTESFREIGAAFTASNPGVAVEFNFASSSALATQIEQAAPADVFASADEVQMRRLSEQSLLEGSPIPFARNALVIVVPADNRARVATAGDLAKPGVKLVLAAPDVPIGNYARQIIDGLAAPESYGPAFRDAALRNVVSNETNVRAVLTKIELGEGDAGIVYRTDAVVSQGKVRTVELPERASVVATYPIAVVGGSRNRAVAEAFVAFVRGPEAQAVLVRAGFERAP
jgi:molybdate transport system substrate-binding protein